ncbi:uncharacterized protein ACJ7VT_020346 [Polymixia lowei]
MADEVTYASVVFTTSKTSPPKAKEEEATIYDDVKVQAAATDQTTDTNRKQTSGCHHIQLVALCLGILCIILVSAIVALCVYRAKIIHENNAQLVSDLKQLNDNHTALLVANQNLTNLVNNLSSTNDNFRKEHSNLTNLMDNLNRDYDILQSKNKNLTTENQQLKIQIEIKHREKNDLNLTRAQWSLDAYCRKEGNSQKRVCQRCEAGWLLFQSSCYVFLDYRDVSEWRTWEEARNHCRERSADLVVIESTDEQGFIFSYGYVTKSNGYWIGLSGTTEAGWRWVDGTNLTTQ